MCLLCVCENICVYMSELCMFICMLSDKERKEYIHYEIIYLFLDICYNTYILVTAIFIYVRLTVNFNLLKDPTGNNSIKL